MTAPCRGLDRSRLPEPAGYYARELPDLKGRGPRRKALCCFHDDHTPSLCRRNSLVP